MRCLALADSLSKRGATICFASIPLDGHLIGEVERRGYPVLQLPSRDSHGLLLDEAADAESFLSALPAAPAVRAGGAVDWVIVDHYSLGRRWTQAVRRRAKRLLVIDDLVNRALDADVLLNQNVFDCDPYGELVATSCAKLLGPRYALLVAHYRDCRRPAPMVGRRPERLLVYFGAADTHLATLTAEVLAGLSVPFYATIVVSATSQQQARLSQISAVDPRIRVIGHLPDLAQAMSSSDLFIGACGTTSWERLCLGLRAIVVTVADNQVPVAQQLSRRGFVRWAGKSDMISERELEQAIIEEMSIPSDPSLSAQMMAAVDGLGAERVADAILFGGEHSRLLFRDITLEDTNLILDWANDPGTRRFAFRSETIESEDHFRWFEEKVKNPNVVFLIAETPTGVPIGQVRFEHQKDNFWETSYMIAPLFRGRRLAINMLGGAIHTLKLRHLNPCIIGLVKTENYASIRVFEALGFSRVGRDLGPEVMRFERRG